ncbi:Gfo/Idh/MocA family oxidoreductase [Aureimonas fodinaquatilis]|uniref:Gfo/Idh/MocA family oxidoreductase n=1 Tax=Aureimonas fodinaquatilis TaxID=2565783 RepID=A0A5B0E0X7_9HYPH|nr:Gfo/Idh/MocA family oxidoreductase [Aureimonas fodinaquatilis]KAA0971119.1 Gfo/Idh/MocA family oxidoreductase [Aureimonas fodinaquatilis]
MSARIAVIGCGQWGQNHVRTLSSLGALAAISDNDPVRAEHLSNQYGVPQLSLEALLASDQIDAATVALPPYLHGTVARQVLSSGKDVLIEKPIALDPLDAAETVELAKSSGQLLMVGHVLRFHPVYEALAQQVAEGRIGELRHIVATRLGLGRFLGMDAVWDLAPHDLSMVLDLAGSHTVTMKSMRSTILSNETDVADIRLTFDNGITAEIHVSRISPFRDRRLSVIGTEGMLTFDDLLPDGQKLAFYGHRVWAEGSQHAFHHADPVYLDVPPGLPLTREMEHFIHCVETRSMPRTGAEEAALVVALLSTASPRA